MSTDTDLYAELRDLITQWRFDQARELIHQRIDGHDQ